MGGRPTALEDHTLLHGEKAVAKRGTGNGGVLRSHQVGVRTCGAVSWRAGASGPGSADTLG